MPVAQAVGINKMAFSKQMKEYRAMVALSVGRVERTPNGREERAERVEKNQTVFLSDAEAANFGRLVRLVSEETPDSKLAGNVSPSRVLGIRDVSKSGAMHIENAGALDTKDETRVYKQQTEAEDDEDAQPTKNPVDPSYLGEDK